MEVLNICPPDVKKSDWVAKLNSLLQDVQEVEVPADMTKQGLLQEAIYEFCRLSESSSRLSIASNGVFRYEEEDEKQWWFTGRDAVIFIQEFKKMRHIKEAEVFTELKNMGATNMAKYIDRTVGNKKIWMLDINEIDDNAVESGDFKTQKTPLPWEE
tara:strand:- start:1245 stop:1715 length:471 start_codon:yes stop_codon:yes gene_type:complete